MGDFLKQIFMVLSIFFSILPKIYKIYIFDIALNCLRKLAADIFLVYGVD